MSPRWFLIPLSGLLLFLLAACTLPTVVPPPTPTPTLPAGPTPTETPAPIPTPLLGEQGNPILLALPPAQFLDPVIVSNGQNLASLIQELTGYRVVAVAPTTYTELIAALRFGNAHIAVLPPYAIVRAYQEGAIQAAFATTQEEVASYGAQFVARSDRYISYFDAFTNSNLEDGLVSLSQFSGKKACWTEPDSSSGHLVPAGILGWYRIPTQEGAFLQSHFSVVRAVRIGEICDFGGTYIDARDYPALEDEYPHLMQEVVVVWQVPPIIPYDGIFFSSSLPADISDDLRAALDQIAITDSGITLLETLFGIQGILEVQDNFYIEFTRYIQSSGVDLNTLVH